MGALALAATLAALVNWADAGPVPGQCAEPSTSNIGRPGCFKVEELRIEAPPGQLWWHIYEFGDQRSAESAAGAIPGAMTATSHGRSWLHVLGPRRIARPGGVEKASIGPLLFRARRRFIAAVDCAGLDLKGGLR